MSAIGGLWRRHGRGGPDGGCASILEAQRRYGADAQAQWSNGADLALGRNLARLLPEDAFDAQPLAGGGGRFALVADIRLDNRAEIASALGIGGQGLERRADSELLLAAWERWEEASLDRLVGDFAFAVWDSERRRLVLARDFAGARPLHFHASGGLLAFASMPAGLHALPEIPRALDLDFVARAVEAGMPPPSGSWFAGIDRVRPGHLLAVSAGEASQRRWWRPPAATLRLGGPQDFAEGLLSHLDAAVRARLRGESRVAAHLSGGLDSSAVATSAAHLLSPGGQVTAFTAVPRPGYCGSRSPALLEEGPLAAATAALWPNVEHVVLPAAGPLPLDRLDEYCGLFGQPVPNLCNMPWMTAIADSARARGIKVLLTGQYGNFAFSYDGMFLLSDLLRRGRLAALSAHMAELWRGGFVRPRSLAGALLRPFLAPGGEPVRERDLRMRAFEVNDVGNLAKGELARSGVDCRDPTADRRLVEFCFATPPEEFVRGGIPRSLARRALAGRVPDFVLAEPRKAAQAPDWHEAAAAQRSALAAGLDAFAATPACRLLPLEPLHAMLAEWPEADWTGPAVSRRYRSQLLRSFALAHFLHRTGQAVTPAGGGG
ncbi:MAG TPA: asparagine synthase-related protein [Allosphingosinicella sp.]